MICRVIRGIRRRTAWRIARRRLRTLLRPLIPKDSLCFDVGANEGHWSRVLLSLGVRVVAVEPQPELGTRFLRRLDVRLEQTAVGAEPGKAELHLASETTAAAHLDPTWQEGRFSSLTWSRSISVPVTTLDALIAKHGAPHYCKIDVEGYEREALKGLSHAVPVLSFEFNGEFFSRAGQCVDEIARLGVYEGNVVVGGLLAFRYQDWVPLPLLLTRLERIVHADPLAWGDVFVRRLQLGH